MMSGHRLGRAEQISVSLGKFEFLGRAAENLDDFCIELTAYGSELALKIKDALTESNQCKSCLIKTVVLTKNPMIILFQTQQQNGSHNFYYFYSNYNLEPMHNEFSQPRIETIDQLPIPQNRRRITDICCCGLGVLFGLIMFILACVLINRQNLIRANYPADSKGNVCMYDRNPKDATLPFLYFNDLGNPLANMQCVSDCPQRGAIPQCWNGTCDINYYPNHPHSDKLGSFCLPDDPEAQDKVIKAAGINNFSDVVTAIEILLISFGIAVAIGIVWMLLVLFLPNIMVWAAFALALIVLAITAVLFLVDARDSLWRYTGWAIFLSIVFAFLAIMLIAYLCINRRIIAFSSVFLSNASQMIKKNWGILLYILLFMVLTILFCILIVFQYLAFSSAASPQKVSDSIYLKLVRTAWFMIPLVIETLWGLSFFRDAFNFCVSGSAVEWYFSRKVTFLTPLKILFTKHVGSVAGGSFLNAFLYLPNLFIDLCCNHVNSFCCNCLDLPRGDAYPYIYMTSTSYCPSVRQVQYLCKRSRICRGNESTNTFFALAARLFVALLTMLIAYGIMESRLTGGNVNALVLLGVFLMSLFVTHYFVDLHVDVAQALMVAFLAEWDLDLHDYKQMNIARDSLKNAIDDLDKLDFVKS